MRTLLVPLFCAALFGHQAVQGPLTDQRIMSLVAVGVSAPEILRIIGSAPEVNFDLRPIATDAMMKAGVSEEMIRAMAARENGQAPEVAVVTMNAQQPTSTLAAAEPAGSNPLRPQFLEVGVYYQRNGTWIE